MGGRRALNGIAVAVLIVAIGVAAADAQLRRGRFFEPVRSATPESFDGSFNFCRIMFTSFRGGFGGNWSVDYPRADVNLSIRFSELTKARISTDPTGEPNHLVLDLMDPLLFECPFVMMTEVGSAYFSPEEAARLKEYLQKGGFLWADDFWGSEAWGHWASELGKVLPAHEYPVFELPKDHPLFRQHFQIAKVPQIPSINHWAGSGGGTSERYEDSAVAHAMGVADTQGRLMVLMTHNTDFGDSWEREADDPNYFYRFSVDGYAFGINVLLYLHDPLTVAIGMSEITRIIDQFEREHDGDPWHGSPLLTILEDVDATQAARKPVTGAHSIWELVLHVTGWKNEVAKRAAGGPASEPEQGDWPEVGDPTPARWKSALQHLNEAHRKLIDAIKALPESKLYEPTNDPRNRPLGSGVPYYVLLHGAVQHDVYHAGQIAILKKSS